MPQASQSILKEISPEYSLEELMVKLKLQYFGHLMWRTDSLEKTLMLGNIEGRRRRGWQRIRRLDGTTDSMDVNLSKLRELVIDRKPGVLQSMGSKRVRQDWVTELNWNYREGTQSHLSTENWIKDLLSMAPHIRTRPSFPLSHSLPSGSFNKPLILFH